MILIVLGTDHFVERHFLLALAAPGTLRRIPRRCECAGILNVNLDFQPLAAVAASACIEHVSTIPLLYVSPGSERTGPRTR
jgi:hypothetical protein